MKSKTYAKYKDKESGRIKEENTENISIKSKQTFSNVNDVNK
jgi:hypothetical protein